MYDLTICSIFRDSESYLKQYLDQIESVFANDSGRYCAIWLEGDSRDNTYDILQNAKNNLTEKNIDVKLIKHNTNGPYWKSENNKDRWHQLSGCWNRCLENIEATNFVVCVESDIRYAPSVVHSLIGLVNNTYNVIFPMLMIDDSAQICKDELFYDTWGFSRAGKKFNNFPPYFQNNSQLLETSELLQLSTGGGMIVSTGEIQKLGRFDNADCIMKYPQNVKLYMHKGYRIYHPMPQHLKINRNGIRK